MTRSDGLLSATSGGDGARVAQESTDSAGFASVFWRLGNDAGCGNNRVVATSVGVFGSPMFCASATPGPASQINIGSGNNQFAEAGTEAPRPLRTWVSDGCNGVEGVPVDFTVIQGDGV